MPHLAISHLRRLADHIAPLLSYNGQTTRLPAPVRRHIGCESATEAALTRGAKRRVSTSERDERGEAPLVRILGRRGSAPCHAVRDFLYRSDVPFEWVELRSDEEARTLAGVARLHDPRLPVCLFPADGTRMECSSIRQITEKLGWFRSPSRSEYDLAIYGAGPAGLSAAVYGGLSLQKFTTTNPRAH